MVPQRALGREPKFSLSSGPLGLLSPHALYSGRQPVVAPERGPERPLEAGDCHCSCPFPGSGQWVRRG